KELWPCWPDDALIEEVGAPIKEEVERFEDRAHSEVDVFAFERLFQATELLKRVFSPLHVNAEIIVDGQFAAGQQRPLFLLDECFKLGLSYLRQLSEVLSGGRTEIEVHRRTPDRPMQLLKEPLRWLQGVHDLMGATF